MTLKGFPYPLKVGRNNAIQTLEDEDVKSEEIRATLKTTRGERVNRPNVGNNIVKYLFLPMGVSRRSAIRDEVIRAIEDNVDDITIETVEVIDDESTRHTDVLVIYFYQGKRKRTTINLA